MRQTHFVSTATNQELIVLKTPTQMSSSSSCESRAPVEINDSANSSDPNLGEKLSRYRALLSNRLSHSSSVPHQEISLFVTETVQSGSPSVIIDACLLYLDLLAKVSISYDDVTFSSCLHHVCRILKASVSATCPKKCSKKTTLCVLDQHIPAKRYISYWQRMTDLLCSGIPDVDNHSGTNHLITAFAKLLHFSSHQALLEHSVRGISHICRSRRFSISVISTVYKEMFPVVIVSLPTLNRDAVIDAVLETIQPLPDVTLDERQEVDKENDPHSTPNCSESTNSSGGFKLSPNTRLFTSFFKLCCLHVVDKAEERASLCYVLERVFSSLPVTYREALVNLLVKCCSHSKVSVRLMAVDLSAQIIKTLDVPSTSFQMMSKMLVDRSNDKVGSVRAKSISCLTDVVKKSRLQSSDSSFFRFLRPSLTVIGQKLQDPKSTVRKVAVDYTSLLCMLLEVTPSIIVQPVSQDQVPLLSSTHFAYQISLRCSDNVASVRLAACIQLRQLIFVLASTVDQRKLELVSICFENILSMIDDNDSRCRDASLHTTHGLIFRQLSASDNDLLPSGDESFDQQRDEVSNQFLKKLGSNNVGFNRKVERAIQALSRDGRITKQNLAFVSRLVDSSSRQSLGDETMRKGAWIILSAITATGMEFPMASSVREDVIKGVGVNDNPQALKAMTSVVSQLSTEETKKLETVLVQNLFHSESNDGEVVDAAGELLSKINECLGMDLLCHCDETVSEQKDLAESTIVNVLLWVSSICTYFKLSKTPSETLLTFIQAMASNEQTLPRIRALALTALGKLCLSESLGSSKIQKLSIGEVLTRRFVPVLVHELDNATSSATRNNAVVILCDLCRQYTSVVEPFTPRIAGLLSDPSPFVRNQVLSSLVSLLQEDYLKVRPGILLHQIVRCVLDKSCDVRATAEYTLTYVVPQKNKCLLSVFFVEAMFVLNECESSCVFTHYKTALQASGSLAGNEHSQNRDTAYNVLLRAMPPEQRLRIPGRFRSDILEPILEEKLDIESSSVRQVLEDCFRLLVSDKLYLFVKNGIRQPSFAADEADGTETGGQSSIVRNVHIIEVREYTVPVLLQLRNYLQNKRSPLLGSLMQCICSLLHPHKNQLDQFITDATIRTEIEHEWESKVKNSLKSKAKVKEDSEENVR